MCVKSFFEHREFLRYTGCRRGEILSLLWNQVELGEGVVRLDPGTTKNDEPGVAPMTAELRSILAEQKTLRHREYPVCQ